jgi:F-type H+-transporting ATPase subunit delta
MAEVATIARPYAEAAFSLADSTGKLAEWSSVLGQMAQVAADPVVRKLIDDPHMGAERLYGLFMSLAQGNMFGEAQNFVRLLIENHRVALLPEIHAQFETLKNQREGVVEAEIATAFSLDQAQLASLVADLERRFKRKINPRVTVDPELIGGVRIAVGDEVIDGSVRGKLAAMAAGLSRT